MKAQYYDPLFYICSEEMPFVIRMQITMKEPVDGAVLTEAVNTAIRRYPYFCLQLKEEEGELLAEPNSRPVVVYEGTEPLPLGSEAVNRHMVAMSYSGREMNLYASHVITDGSGIYPFVKSMLYYYISRRHGVELDAEGVRLFDTPFLPDELGNPYPEDKMAAAEPFYQPPKREYFRLIDGGYVTDHTSTVYRFRLNQAEIMRFNHDNDGSPCVLVSSLMAKAIWAVHPEEKKDIVSAVSFNMRPGLGNKNNFRMLCNALMLRYPERLKKEEISRVCTCSRGMISVQSQPENVLSYAEQWRRQFTVLERFKSVRAKREIVARQALLDAGNNTFSISYAGNVQYGSLLPYLESLYVVTDGSTYETLFIEVSSVGEWFDVTFLQGFSSDVYYRAFLAELQKNGLSYIEEGHSPMGIPKTELP